MANSMIFDKNAFSDAYITIKADDRSTWTISNLNQKRYEIPILVEANYKAWLTEGLVKYGMTEEITVTDDGWLSGNNNEYIGTALCMGHLHRFSVSSVGLTECAKHYLTSDKEQSTVVDEVNKSGS